MTQEHPITPPPNLVQEWYHEADNQLAPYYVYMAHQAARWGADQELEACCEWVSQFDYGDCSYRERLRAIRRPKPPSLKEQALAELNLTTDSDGAELSRTQVELIRRALESLPD